ncbi:XRE family transcriptional regulator [Streptomyces bangladeshensis]|uniref:XRE family transcriptional regulator n=1 Tax=Streptomyces bangladeshensis TaxID=295352 RepID=A0ABP5NXH4_9ACTN
MPRWKALPDDLEPQIEEFTVQLRQSVDRSGLSIAALADRTGYSRTSWERYLGGRLLAPKGAVVALAEATGTHAGHLTTLWELAERAWSRAELRHDHARDALRITEARAALGALAAPGEEPGEAAGGAPPKAARRTPAGAAGRKAAGKGMEKSAGKGAASGAGAGAGKDMEKGPGKGTEKGAWKGAAKGVGRGVDAVAVPGIAGPAGVSPTIPARPADPDTDVLDGVARGTGSGVGSDASAEAAAAGADARTGAEETDAPPKNSWGLAGYRGPSKASARPGPRPPAHPSGSADTPGIPTGTPVGTPSGWPAARSSGPAATPPGTTRTPGTSGRTPGTPGRTPGSSAKGTDTPAGTPVGTARPVPGTPDPSGGQPAVPRPAPVDRWSARRQQLVMFFAGLVGAGALIAGVFFFTHRDGDGRDRAGAGASPSPSATARTSPPPGVECTGSACTGKDAEAMGCSGELVTTAKTATVGTTTLEVRYSKACGTAWGRITSGAPGDTVRVSVGEARQTGDITAAGDTIGYTPMIAVRDPKQARACATLATGQTGCTE